MVAIEQPDATSNQAVLSPLTTPEHFESIYSAAHGDASRIPWEDGRANPALVKWLNEVAPSILRCGSRTCVVGCGLGHDARELLHRGYEVTAFDCSATAVNWAQQMNPDTADCFVRGDLFRPAPRWKHRFDLVVEVNTIQSLSPDLHEGALRSIADLVSVRGRLLVICRASDESARVDDGPPWALTQDFLLEKAAACGLEPEEPIRVFMDDELPPVRRMIGVFKRG